MSPDDSEPRAAAIEQPPADLAADVNARIRATYAAALREERWPAALKLRWPLQYSSLRTGCAVFVGMNPSEARDFPLADAEDLDDEDALRAVLDHERECLGLVDGKSGHSYYGHFNRLAPGGWSHIDLFPAREKKQDAFKAALALDDRRNWHRLAREWFDISVDLLCALQPRVVVVVNAFASDLLHDEASQRWGHAHRRPCARQVLSATAGVAHHARTRGRSRSRRRRVTGAAAAVSSPLPIAFARPPISSDVLRA